MNKLVLSTLPVLFLSACAGPRATDAAPAPLQVKANQDLASMIEGEGRTEDSFGIFGSAVLASDVTQHLQPGQPYTLIAVRDRDLDGFLAELGTVDPMAIETILGFHVLPGRIGSDMLADDTSFETLSGQRLFVSNWGGEVELYARTGSARSSRATIVASDVPFDGGLLHFVDRPLLPATDDLRSTLEGMETFQYLLSAADLTGTATLLEATGAVTLLAPTDRAFEEALGAPFDPADPALVEALQEIVEDVMHHHLVAGRMYSRDFATGTLDSLGGGRVDVQFDRTGFAFGGARVVRSDIETRNGVIHVIDGIIRD